MLSRHVDPMPIPKQERTIPPTFIRSETKDFLLQSENNLGSELPVARYVNCASPLAQLWRTRKWQSIGSHCIAFLFVCGAIVALIVVSIMCAPSSYTSTDTPFLGFCEPDGTFNTGLESMSAWWPSKAFHITLAFGPISFSTAKFVDIMWDVVIGRIVQAILGVILYRIFTKSLARIMEDSSVSFGTFESVTLQGPSIWALVLLINDYGKNRGARTKLAVSWMIFAMSFVLAFPTLMSAMSGYSATTKPYIKTQDGNQVEWSSFRLVNYIIHDGWRVGLTGNYLVNALSDGVSDPISPSDADANICSGYGRYYEADYSFTDGDFIQKCLLTTAVSEYVRTYGFNRTNDTSSTFSPDNSTTFNLTSPSLNISIFYIYPLGDLYGTLLIDLSTDGAVPANDQVAFGDPSFALFARTDLSDNQTYDMNYIKNNGHCLQQHTYQWGFSFLLLFIALLLSALWAVGVWAMWLDAYWNSRSDGVSDRDMGSWRAVMDLAEGISGALNGDISSGSEPGGEMMFAGTKHLGDNEIRKRIQQASSRCQIGYASLAGHGKFALTRSTQLKRWLERRRWGSRLLRWRVEVITCATGVVLLLTVACPALVTSVRTQERGY